MDNNLLQARITDTIDLAFTTNKPKFLGFLSLEEIAFVKSYLQRRNANHSFFGGFDEAERQMLCCFPDWMENPSFPISAITFTYRESDNLRHRDFLGALMSLGIKREIIGDILIEQGRAVAFLKSDIIDFLIDNISKVGNFGVTLNHGFTYPLPERDALKQSSLTVASARLDCVVSALAGCSRAKACELIESGMVSLNSQIIEKTTKTISDGDVLSIRRKGKFQIVSTQDRTKKDRIILLYKAY